MMEKLTALEVDTIKKPGRHGDGDGLYLKVRKGGSRQWVMLWIEMIPAPDGKTRRKSTELSLGRADGKGKAGLSLAMARKKAAEIRQQRMDGLDPKAERRKTATVIPTFAAAAASYLEAHGPSFRNAKHRAQWAMTLGPKYCAAILNTPVDQIDTGHVLAVLQPIWATVPETASRIRARIERVLAAAIAAGHRAEPNPARWKHHLDTLLGKRQKLSRGHHAALPFSDMPEFMTELRKRDGASARALEFLILNAARSNEVLGAKWGEIDLQARIFTVPATRMKAGREHRVPLSDAALEVLNQIPKGSADSFIFPGAKPGRPLSVMALSMVLRRMGRADITTHGFRSSFRDWVGEKTDFQREVAEAALAHVVGDAAERAYRRGDALDKRRAMMNAWARYCAGDDSSSGNVIRLQAR